MDDKIMREQIARQGEESFVAEESIQTAYGISARSAPYRVFYVLGVGALLLTLAAGLYWLLASG